MSLPQTKAKRLSRQIICSFCVGNFRQFLKESNLHGLRFIADTTITLWERAFFLISVISAITTTTHLISYFIAKWITTPVIIGINPQPKFIGESPFPAITICNNNQLMASKVKDYGRASYEAALIEMTCFNHATELQKSKDLNGTTRLSDFIVEHAQPCSRMLLFCQISSTIKNCSDLFQEILTDDGLCCVFNIVHSTFRYKYDYENIRDYMMGSEIPVEWSPEKGYPKNLPSKFYPQITPGIGTSMGLTIILNAELHEYYCASTNGPGFKISVHSPVETPRVRDIGVLVPVGFETRYRLQIHETEAAIAIRSLARNVRQCVFSDEVDQEMLAFKYYTRLNCEIECQTKHIYTQCTCVKHDLPLVYRDARICGPKDNLCVKQAEINWLGQRRSSQRCRRNCLQPCYSIDYSVNAFSKPLIVGNFSFRIDNEQIFANMSKKYISENIAVANLFFQEYIYYSNIRNVYIGFTEFLSNIGGIFSLFMGFSVLSVAEIIYFALYRPFVLLVLPSLRATFSFKEGSSTISAESRAILFQQHLRSEQNSQQQHNSTDWNPNHSIPKNATGDGIIQKPNQNAIRFKRPFIIGNDDYNDNSNAKF